MLLTGKADQPSYLLIENDDISLQPAQHLWGQYDTYETQERIKDERGSSKLRIATIGKAGEQQIPIALILSDHGRVAGRTGMGAVMGSKNLKAVAVGGSQPLLLADPERYAELRARVNRELRDDVVTRTLREIGSSSGSDYFDYLGSMPKRYFSKGELAGVDQVTGTTMAETILAGVSTCQGCVIACGRVVKLDDGEKRKGPEYESMVGFGPNLEVLDLKQITRLSELCDRYGLDTISMSNIIGLAFTLYEQGTITQDDTEGIELKWGDGHAVEALIHQTVDGTGLGPLLAGGARHLSEHFNAPEAAVEVNGLELAYHDPRGGSGMALVYATSPRGGCHNQSDYFMVDIGQSIDEVGVDMMPRLGGAEKALSVARHQDWRTFGNALVLCVFANVPPQDVVDLVSAATGFDYDLDEVMLAGERAWNLKRCFNLKLGYHASDDRLPPKLLQPYEDGAVDNFIPPVSEMLEAYYQVRDWQSSTGAPSPAKLKELDLDKIVRDG
jgi:aldehyde:ferredoxin oxidoreductase